MFHRGDNYFEGRVQITLLTIGAPEYIPTQRTFKKKKKDIPSFIPKSIAGKSSHPKYEDELIKGVKISTPTRLKKPWNLELLSLIIF